MKDICKSKMFSLLKRVAFAPTEKDEKTEERKRFERVSALSLSLFIFAAR